MNTRGMIPEPIQAELKAMAGKTVVIKYGGNAMLSEELKAAVIEDVVALQQYGIKTVLCHGGGPSINRLLKQLDVPSKFINGLRYTSEEVLRVAQMVLIGEVGTDLANSILAQGGKAAGVSGVSGGLYRCHKQSEELGFVGEIDTVDTDIISLLTNAGYVPVVASIGTDAQGNCYNINGDTAAGRLAGSLKAEKLILLTDIVGLCNSLEKMDVISYLNVVDVPELKEKGVISGGMVPKIDGCVQAVEDGVEKVHIVDGREKHCILNAFQKDACGTTVGRTGDSVGIAR